MAEIVGLKNKKCVPCEGGVQPLSESEINRLQKQVGTRRGGGTGLRCPLGSRRSQPAQLESRVMASKVHHCSGSVQSALPGSCSAIDISIWLAHGPLLPLAFCAWQCAGWRVAKNAEGHDCIQHEWKVRNFRSGLDLFQR